LKRKCGAGGIRTHVQTYSPKAFYMLILELIVGQVAGTKQTNICLSWMVLINCHSLQLKQPCFFWFSGLTWQRRARQAAIMDALISD